MSLKKIHRKKINLINYKLTLVLCILEIRVSPCSLHWRLRVSWCCTSLSLQNNRQCNRLSKLKPYGEIKREKNKKRVDFRVHLFLAFLFSLGDPLGRMANREKDVGVMPPSKVMSQESWQLPHIHREFSFHKYTRHLIMIS